MRKPSAFFEWHAKTVGRIDPRLALILLLVSVVIIAGSPLASSRSSDRQQATPSVTLSQTTPTPQPAAIPSDRRPLQPRDIATNQGQTIGLTLAAAALVMIVVIGVFAAFIQNPGDD